MKLLQEYINKKQELLDYFGYKGEYLVSAIPVIDATEVYWETDRTMNAIRVSSSIAELIVNSLDRTYYLDISYDESFFVGPEYTLAVIIPFGSEIYFYIFANDRQYKPEKSA
jgi:hypothetical protein